MNLILTLIRFISRQTRFYTQHSQYVIIPDYRMATNLFEKKPWNKKEEKEKKVGKRISMDSTSRPHCLPLLPLNMSPFGLTIWSSYLFDTRQNFRRASSVVRDGIIYLDRNNFQRDFGYFSSMIFEVSEHKSS